MNPHQTLGEQQANIVNNAMESVHWISNGPSYIRRIAYAAGTVATLGFSPFAEEGGRLRNFGDLMEASRLQNASTLWVASAGTLALDYAVLRPISARRQRAAYETHIAERETDLMPIGLTEFHRSQAGTIELVWTVPSFKEEQDDEAKLKLRDYGPSLLQAAKKGDADVIIVHTNEEGSVIDENELLKTGACHGPHEEKSYLVSLNYQKAEGKRGKSTDVGDTQFYVVNIEGLSDYIEKNIDHRTKKLEQYLERLKELSPRHPLLRLKDKPEQSLAQSTYQRSKGVIERRLYRDEPTISEDKTRRFRNSQRGEIIHKGADLKVRWINQNGAVAEVVSLRSALEMNGENVEQLSADKKVHPNKRRRAYELLIMEESANILFNNDYEMVEGEVRISAETEQPLQPSHIIATRYGLSYNKKAFRAIEFNKLQFLRKIAVTSGGLLMLLGAQAALMRDGAENESEYARDHITGAIVEADERVDQLSTRLSDKIIGAYNMITGENGSLDMSEPLGITATDYYRSVLSVTSPGELPKNKPLIEVNGFGTSTEGYWYTEKLETIVDDTRGEENIQLLGYPEELRETLEVAEVAPAYADNQFGERIEARIRAEDLGFFGYGWRDSRNEGSEEIVTYTVFRFPIREGMRLEAISIDNFPQGAIKIGASTYTGEQVVYIDDTILTNSNITEGDASVRYLLKPTDEVVPRAQYDLAVYDPSVGIYRPKERLKEGIERFWKPTGIDLDGNPKKVAAEVKNYIQGLNYSLDDTGPNASVESLVSNVLYSEKAFCTTGNLAYLASAPIDLAPVIGFYNSDNSKQKDGRGSKVISATEAHFWTADGEGEIHDATPSRGGEKYSEFAEDSFKLSDGPAEFPKTLKRALTVGLISLYGTFLGALVYFPVKSKTGKVRRNHAYKSLHMPSIEGAYRKINQSLYAPEGSSVDTSTRLPERSTVEAFLQLSSHDGHQLSWRERRNVRKLKFAKSK